MRYMIVERFKEGALKLVYERFDDHGRLMPDGLNYVDSWISEDMSVCYQLMETDNEKLLQQWIDQWKDLVDFDIVQVISSAKARKKALGEE